MAERDPASASTSADAQAPHEDDFGPAVVVPEPPINSQLLSSRVAILYNASSMFECALAATLKCEKSVASMPGHADYSIVAKDLLACNPHVIIALGNAWPNELYEKIGERIILVLCDHATVAAAPPGTTPYVMQIDPPLFAKIAPCRSEISAYMIFSHLMRGEFSRHFKDGLEEARYFRLALRSSTHSSLEAWTFVDKIVNNWQQVMDPENLVRYGQFLTNVGPKIAHNRIEKHSVLIKLEGPPPQKTAYKIRVIGSEDFEEVVANIALQTDEIVIIYSLSADTTQCYLTCRLREDMKDLCPRDILALITPRAEVEPQSEASNTVTCVTNDFFALVRTSIVLPQDASAPSSSGTSGHDASQPGSSGSAGSSSPEEQAVIAEGEKVLAAAAPLLEGKN